MRIVQRLPITCRRVESNLSYQPSQVRSRRRTSSYTVTSYQTLIVSFAATSMSELRVSDYAVPLWKCFLLHRRKPVTLLFAGSNGLSYTDVMCSQALKCCSRT
jgi:hypothetical protein